MSWPLADSGDEKIDVVDIGIQQLESVDDLLGDQVLHLVEGVDFAQSAVSTEGSISCKTKKKCFAITLVFNSRYIAEVLIIGSIFYESCQLLQLLHA